MVSTCNTNELETQTRHIDYTRRDRHKVTVDEIGYVPQWVNIVNVDSVAYGLHKMHR